MRTELRIPIESAEHLIKVANKIVQNHIDEETGISKDRRIQERNHREYLISTGTCIVTALLGTLISCKQLEQGLVMESLPIHVATAGLFILSTILLATHPKK